MRAGWIQAARLKEIPPLRTGSRRARRTVRGDIVAEEGNHMAIHDVAEPGMRESVAALPGTRVASAKTAFPQTRPASWHRLTTRSKKRRKTASPRRWRIRVKPEASGNASSRDSQGTSGR